MSSAPISLVDEVGLILANLAESATGGLVPTVRLGVTGLSRAGKTVFITALVHALINGVRLPGFAAQAEGRLIGAALDEHPERHVPRFAYEQHIATLTGADPVWPDSTRRISQIRLTLKYQSARWIAGMMGPGEVHLDIVDYPGEWLLDLPLLSLGFAEWSEIALTRAARLDSEAAAKPFFQELSGMDATSPADETTVERIAGAFAAYLRAARAEAQAMSTLTPGRFLMPGDLEGSPALTFAPLPAPNGPVGHKSLYRMFERRYEAYKHVVVQPFFRDHFARLDRQIVLVDVLKPLNAGAGAVADLETALSDILACFRQGSGSLLSGIVARRIDRILFAASKADHIHHTSHDRLDAILNRLVARAGRRARFAGAETRSLAMAAVRATREGRISHDGSPLDVIIGTPEAGERLDGAEYDGRTEIALFPGDLPETPEQALSRDGDAPLVNFMRFRPPSKLGRTDDGLPVLPHIRLDRAVDFLIGDKLR
ncbi:MAG: YcjX family protein [Alphaproteobacteria bacterium]|nr:YcjX family protein [Alphaproteobacteria bacterium]